MHILSYTLILFIVACAPQEENKNPAQTNQNKNQADNPEPDDSTSTPEIPIANTPAVVENPVQQNALEEEPPLPPEEEKPVITEIQYILNQLHGSYQFDLDVYQKWTSFQTFWTIFYANVPVSLNLVQNPRMHVEQLLIEVVSSTEDPGGKFCAIQSSFELQKEESSDTETPEKAALKAISAQQYTANEGGIVDINNVKNTIEINTYEPLEFTLEFYGNHGSESISLDVEDKINENITHDFDSLCQFCGFEIGQNGLCQ
ncbi:MAG: hypothetical protein OXK80_06010 [Bdellovibrionales bacterium]|nr:hypothetical protein [Bdellovibrionales bacterium]